MKPCPAVSWGTIAAVMERAGIEVASSANTSTQAGGATGKAGKDAKAGAPGPYLIYFCSEQLGETAGLGTLALRERAKQKDAKPYKLTIFESLPVIEGFKKAGLTEYYKVTASKENVELIKKYSVRQDNTLVFCAPTGDMVACLAGMRCNQTEVLKVLKVWPQLYEAWQKRQAAK